MTLGASILAGSWLIIVTVLVLDLIGILRRGTGFRWQAVGLLVMNTALDVSGFAHLHGWSGTQLSAFQLVTIPVMLAGFLIFGGGLAIQVKDRRRERRASKS